jgi:hypothetical protein
MQCDAVQGNGSGLVAPDDRGAVNTVNLPQKAASGGDRDVSRADGGSDFGDLVKTVRSAYREGHRPDAVAVTTDRRIVGRGSALLRQQRGALGRRWPIRSSAPAPG